ncbi:MAG: MFS transporter [Saprospiraceae bacterium]|nr:MFS transporter [Saprospiraceae bacterium]
MATINKGRLFNASCIALTVTAMTFAIRAGILSQLGVDFKLTDTELGWVNAMAFLGFPIATMIGGPLYNAVGPRKIMWVAFITHLLGLIMTIFAGGFWTLLISTFFIGFANGSVEAACNPMIANMFDGNKTTMLNKFHVWFPGGIVIGALVSALMTNLGLGWQLQIAIMLIPTLIYAWMIFGQQFPEEPESEAIDFKKLFPPIYLTIVFGLVLIAASDLTLQQWFPGEASTYLKYGLIVLVAGLIYQYFGLLYSILALCMTLTATAELGTQQWVEKILGNSGAHPMLILAMITGLMAVGRYFGGPLIHKFKPIGVLFGSAVVATLGIGLMSVATGGMVYFAAVLFAIGVMYFWPTMIGATAEYTPQTGALGLSFIGGVGMFATSLWQPVIGGWLDTERASAIANGLAEEAADLAAGQATLDNLAVFPAILIVLFGILYFTRGKWQPKAI